MLSTFLQTSMPSTLKQSVAYWRQLTNEATASPAEQTEVVPATSSTTLFGRREGLTESDKAIIELQRRYEAAKWEDDRPSSARSSPRKRDSFTAAYSVSAAASL